MQKLISACLSGKANGQKTGTLQRFSKLQLAATAWRTVRLFGTHPDLKNINGAWDILVNGEGNTEMEVRTDHVKKLKALLERCKVEALLILNIKKQD